MRRIRIRAARMVAALALVSCAACRSCTPGDGGPIGQNESAGSQTSATPSIPLGAAKAADDGAKACEQLSTPGAGGFATVGAKKQKPVGMGCDEAKSPGLTVVLDICGKERRVPTAPIIGGGTLDITVPTGACDAVSVRCVEVEDACGGEGDVDVEIASRSLGNVAGGTKLQFPAPSGCHTTVADTCSGDSESYGEASCTFAPAPGRSIAVSTRGNGMTTQLLLRLDPTEMPDTDPCMATGDAQPRVYDVHLHWLGFDPEKKDAVIAEILRTKPADGESSTDHHASAFGLVNAALEPLGIRLRVASSTVRKQVGTVFVGGEATGAASKHTKLFAEADPPAFYQALSKFWDPTSDAPVGFVDDEFAINIYIADALRMDAETYGRPEAVGYTHVVKADCNGALVPPHIMLSRRIALASFPEERAGRVARVLAHELTHFVGLDHPDDFEQSENTCGWSSRVVSSEAKKAIAADPALAQKLACYEGAQTYANLQSWSPMREIRSPALCSGGLHVEASTSAALRRELVCDAAANPKPGYVALAPKGFTPVALCMYAKGATGGPTIGDECPVPVEIEQIDQEELGDIEESGTYLIASIGPGPHSAAVIRAADVVREADGTYTISGEVAERVPMESGEFGAAVLFEYIGADPMPPVNLSRQEILRASFESCRTGPTIEATGGHDHGPVIRAAEMCDIPTDPSYLGADFVALGIVKITQL